MFKSIKELISFVKTKKNTFFNTREMVAFDSQVHEYLNKDYFITSERGDHYSRKYTIRKADKYGKIHTIGKFQQYSTFEEAKEALDLLIDKQVASKTA